MQAMVRVTPEPGGALEAARLAENMAARTSKWRAADSGGPSDGRRDIIYVALAGSEMETAGRETRTAGGARGLLRPALWTDDGN